MNHNVKKNVLTIAFSAIAIVEASIIFITL